MKINIYFITFVSILFISCQQDGTNGLGKTNYPTQSVLEIVREIKFDKVAFTKLYKLDNDLFLADIKDNNFFFAVLDSNLNLIKKILEKNNPTDSIPNYFEVSSFSSKASSFSFILNDINQGKVSELSYDLERDSFSIKEITDYPIEMNLGYVFNLGNGKILGNVTNLDYNMDLVRVHNPLLEESEARQNLALLFKPKPTYDDATLLYNFNTLHTGFIEEISQDKFVYALPLLKQVMIFNSDLEILNEIPTPFNQNDVDTYISSNGLKSDIQDFIKAIKITEDRIVFFYQELDKETKKIKENAFLVYNHNLKPLAKYTVPNSLYSFEINTQNNQILAVDFNNETVYVYNIDI